jgi:hypothetical protein
MVSQNRAAVISAAQLPLKIEAVETPSGRVVKGAMFAGYVHKRLR